MGFFAEDATGRESLFNCFMISVVKPDEFRVKTAISFGVAARVSPVLKS